MKKKLDGVAETLMIPLWARAAETLEKNPIIRDEKAVELVSKIDYDFDQFEGSWMSQTGVAVRTEILDREAGKFIKQHPDAVIVNIGCGLDTRSFRLDNGRIRWYDLDLPEAVEIRKTFFRETERYKMIGKSVFDYSWIEDIKREEVHGIQHERAHVLFLAEGVMMFFTEKEIMDLMSHLTAGFPGSHMLFEMMPPFVVKNSGRHETVRKTGARFQWGIKSGKDMEKIHPKIKFMEEWNYFNYHRRRWKGLALASLIPAFRNNFNNRIVHIIL